MAKEQFISLKFKELRVVLDPQTKKEVQGSLVASSLYGKFPTGFVAEFKNGLYETADEAVIAALREHPYYGAMFVSASEKGAVKMGNEAARMTNEKKTVADELASTCPKCGKKLKNAEGLKIHMRSHEE
jgi:hypothetical protein